MIEEYQDFLENLIFLEKKSTQITNLAEIRKVPEKIIIGSEYSYQINFFPDAPIHDRFDEIGYLGNIFFPEIHPNASNPVKVYEELNKDNQPLSGQELFMRVSSLMLSEDRARPIHIFKWQANQLHEFPLWRLWCAQHETKEDLENEYKKAFNKELDRRKNIVTLKTAIRKEIKELLTKTQN